MVWFLQGNVGPAAFWLLGYLLTNPDAMTAVRKEFSRVSQSTTSELNLMDTPVNTPVFGKNVVTDLCWNVWIIAWGGAGGHNCLTFHIRVV